LAFKRRARKVRTQKKKNRDGPGVKREGETRNSANFSQNPEGEGREPGKKHSEATHEAEPGEGSGAGKTRLRKKGGIWASHVLNPPRKN